jgi:site-specific DNA recombinase
MLPKRELQLRSLNPVMAMVQENKARWPSALSITKNAPATTPNPGGGTWWKFTASKPRAVNPLSACRRRTGCLQISKVVASPASSSPSWPGLPETPKNLLEFADIFREYNADLISLGETIDTSTPAGRLFFTIVAAMAQWEREEISARVAASVPVRAQLGKPIDGAAPFGYQWKERRLVLDPKEAPIRKLLFELFAEHKRFKTVATLLNESGYRTRNGAKFSDTTVERLLTDPIAKRRRRANYTKSLGNKKHWELKSESEWVFSEVEAIVSKELWERCNRIIAERSNGNGKKPAREAVQLFAGLAYCDCGSKMYVPSNSPKYICYQCRNKIPVGDLETVFQEQLKGFFFSPDELSAYLNEADQIIKEKEELLHGLERERRKLQAEMDKLFELYLAGEIPKEGFGKRYQPMETRLKQIDDQIPVLQGEVDFLKIRHLSSDEIIHEARNFYTHWPQLDHSEKRQVIETITEKIVIGQGDVTINLYFLPAFPSLASEQRNYTHAVISRPQSANANARPADAKPYLKIFDPLRCRIDIHIDVLAMKISELLAQEAAGGSTEIRESVVRSQVQQGRFAEQSVYHNTQVTKRLNIRIEITALAKGVRTDEMSLAIALVAVSLFPFATGETGFGG